MDSYQCDLVQFYKPVCPHVCMHTCMCEELNPVQHREHLPPLGIASLADVYLVLTPITFTPHPLHTFTHIKPNLSQHKTH